MLSEVASVLTRNRDTAPCGFTSVLPICTCLVLSTSCSLHLLGVSSTGRRGVFGSSSLGPPLWIAGWKGKPANNLDCVGGLLADGGNFVPVICLRFCQLRAGFAPSSALLLSPRPPSVLPPSLIHLFVPIAQFFFPFFPKELQGK